MLILSLKEQIENLISPILAEGGLDLVEMKFSHSGPVWHLRIFIDKPGGVTVEDCARASREVSDLLDTKDIIPHKYLLEISSPGLDRPLVSKADFKRKMGKKVRVFLKEGSLQDKELKGEIVGLKNENLILQSKSGEIAIPLMEIVKAKIIF